MTVSNPNPPNKETEVDKSTQPFAVERAAEPHQQGAIEATTPEPAEDRTEPGAPRRAVVAAPPPPPTRSIWPIVGVVGVVGVIAVLVVSAIALALS